MVTKVGLSTHLRHMSRRLSHMIEGGQGNTLLLCVPLRCVKLLASTQEGFRGGWGGLQGTGAAEENHANR